MITGELKSQIDKIWNDFWTGGISNPLTVIEQFTYLIFLKQLDDKQTTIEEEKTLFGASNHKDIYASEQNELRWSFFKDKDPEVMFDIFTKPNPEIDNLTAFDFMKTLGAVGGKFSEYMKGATFMIPTPNLLDRVVQQIDKLPLNRRDTKGDLYEYMLSKIAEAGTNGQFRTPRHIIRMMVELMQPQQEDTVCDPAMGTAGFLVATGEYLHERHQDWFLDKTFRRHFSEDMFHGIEIDPSMMRIASMNLQLHGIESPNITGGSALAESNTITGKYSLILANPPFKGALNYDEVESSLLQVTKTKKTELLFLSLILRMLKLGGRAAVIVPDGVLFGNSTAHKNIRKELIENHQLQGVISMPSGVFKPYAGVSTAILLFTKTNTGGTEKVWFYDMTADGYSLDDKRTAKITNEQLEACFDTPETIMKEVAEHCDIPRILTDWRNIDKVGTDRTQKSFLVAKADIVANDYDLSINRYKEIVYETIAYETPSAIIAQIKDLQAQRQQAMEALEKMLNAKM
ncbi:class I SAM-dependent DNA methyltransferase [Riemerella anatipestifer]|uniref:type I restriction-modification system subunit M n=1 Tax=Riemerella anatipestifer TaxID=34085 RepID=UPI0028632C01|nr:class I SAM-dependent DNA methyltransferase [Riemerella anatipestifer]MDR7818866.1 class I SAM-dependent DNA methyltransferase [Riemerella anatipestifer]MDR7850818.1 class I SAM-dependent DNA methyltransferase [Riemerella anatipestifer]MDR7881519.1 class I SAM-dependent DNA methyltransferase [Riemerella anatipestifer]